jgi:hypothetical protein
MNQHTPASTSLSMQAEAERPGDNSSIVPDRFYNIAGPANAAPASQDTHMPLTQQQHQQRVQNKPEAVSVNDQQQGDHVSEQLPSAAHGMMTASLADDSKVHTSRAPLASYKTMRESGATTANAVQMSLDADLLSSDEESLAVNGSTPAFPRPPAPSTAPAALPQATATKPSMPAPGNGKGQQQTGSSTSALSQTQRSSTPVARALPPVSVKHAGSMQEQQTTKAQPADAGFGMTADMFGSPSSSSGSDGNAEEVVAPRQHTPVAPPKVAGLRGRRHEVSADAEKAIPVQNTRKGANQDSQRELQRRSTAKPIPAPSTSAAAVPASSFLIMKEASSMVGNLPEMPASARLAGAAGLSGQIGTLRAIQTPAEQIRVKDGQIAQLQERVSTMEAEMAKERGEVAAKVAQAHTQAAARAQEEIKGLQADVAAARAATDAARERSAEREASLQVCFHVFARPSLVSDPPACIPCEQ